MSSRTTTVADFFENEAVDYPLERGKIDFETFADNTLRRYIEYIKGICPGDAVATRIQQDVAKVETLSHHLMFAIRHSLQGLPHRAYSRFNEGIRSVLDEFVACQVKITNTGYFSELYRIRVEKAEPGKIFDKGELFHTPFHLRHKVARQRYSIPGLPCLYLGGSVYICWEELNRPTFESIHLARFEAVKEESIRILDFVLRPKHIAAKLRHGGPDSKSIESHVYDYAILWPLMALASIRRSHGDSPFIVEYIIPQLILQWITAESDPALDGIGYSSVRCKTHIMHPLLIANFVFPAKFPLDLNIPKENYCPSLRKQFALTEPIPWHLLARVFHFSVQPSSSDAKIEFIPGRSSSYSASEFCVVESRLRSTPASIMPESGKTEN